MAAGINQAVTEALAFGETMGLDMDKVVDIVATGAAGNWFLDHRGKTMLADTYAPGFKLSLHHKDLEICQTMLKNACDASLPMIEMTLIHYQRLILQKKPLIYYTSTMHIYWIVQFQGGWKVRRMAR